jgi:phage tail tape-measure protein
MSEGTILYMEVLKEVRRQGVGTFLHNQIKEHYDILDTSLASKEGESFVKSIGYKFNKLSSSYIINKTLKEK